MVDARMAGDRRDGRQAVAALVPRILVGDDALAAYANAAASLDHAPPQSLAWVSAWQSTANPDLVLAMLERNGQAVLALPLEILGKGRLRIAAFPGLSHASGNFPPCQPGAVTGPDLDALFAALSRARPDIDIVVLERLQRQRAGAENPLLALPHRTSANVALAADLTGGFDALLSRASGKRKRKKHRSQQRKFEAIGVVERSAATTRAQAEKLLDIFFHLKGIRLTQLGVPDVFAGAGVRAFFRKLFGDSAEAGDGAFVLHRLAVAGKIRAISGSSIEPGRTVCEFSAIAFDDLLPYSPGEYLFYDNIEESCGQGQLLYDFSVGDEPFKRLWCGTEIWHADVVVPLSLPGRIHALWLAARAGLVRAIKANPATNRMLRKWRRRSDPSVAEAESNDD